MEQEFCMNILDWVDDSTQLVWNVLRTLKTVCSRMIFFPKWKQCWMKTLYKYRKKDPEHEAPSSFNTAVYLSWFLNSEDVLGGKFHRWGKVVLICEHKNCGRQNVKGSDKYVTLDISLKCNNLDKMEIISSESIDKLRISGKGLITSLGIKAKVSPHIYKR